MLNLYRRDRRDCAAGHAEESRSGEFEERKKGWKRCACHIFASGSIAGKFRRKNTGSPNWEEAKTIASHWGQTDSLDSEILVPQVAPEVVLQNRVTIEHASKSFLDDRHESDAPRTYRKYRLLLKKFREFSESRGSVMIDQWQPNDVREFRAAWAISPNTASRRLSMLKSFFEYCVSNEWLARNPARLVKIPRGRDASEKRAEQKLPFTDDELKRMYDTCPKYGYLPKYAWNGDDLADFISLSTYTGLRISDVSQFQIDRMNKNGEILVRTTKAGPHVYTWVPEWLQDRIRARAKIHGPHIFGRHTSKSLDVITDVWRRKLKKLWAMCGTWKVKPTPHRFRHTFARILLQKPGGTVRDVAELLGNTEEMVLAAYSAWVPERQERLIRVLREAFKDKPKPKVVAFPGRNA
jgi:integrase